MVHSKTYAQRKMFAPALSIGLRHQFTHFCEGDDHNWPWRVAGSIGSDTPGLPGDLEGVLSVDRFKFLADLIGTFQSDLGLSSAAVHGKNKGRIIVPADAVRLFLSFQSR